MYTQPLLDAIAESERLVKEASFIESEADLLEGLQYLAGCVAACTHVAFDYDRDHPFLHSGTGPFTKMGLDNPPDTMYFGTRVVAGHEYVVTGKRGGPPPTSASSSSAASTPTRWFPTARPRSTTAGSTSRPTAHSSGDSPPRTPTRSW